MFGLTKGGPSIFDHRNTSSGESSFGRLVLLAMTIPYCLLHALSH